MYSSDGLFYVLKYMDVGGKGILAEVSAKLSRKRCFITDFSADDHENSRSLCRANVVEPVGNMSMQFGRLFSTLCYISSITLAILASHS